MKPCAPAVLSLVVLLGACSIRENAPAENDTVFDQDLQTLQGTWKPVSMEMDGEFLPDERIEKVRLTIEGENFTFDNGNDTHGGLYKIDPGKDPKQLDIVITRGDEVGKTYLVIYKFADGKMIQCMEVSNDKRPTDFTGKAGSGNLHEIWERHE